MLKQNSGRKGSSSQPSPGFLFITNKLLIEKPDWDIYRHLIPPGHPNQYRGEIPSKVMRYCNGEVTEATDFYWYRNTDTLPASQGQLLRIDDQRNYVMDHNSQCYYAEEYKTFGVAACNPLLPIMVTDQDPLVSEAFWELLRIFHPPRLPGLSQVVTLHSDMGVGGAPVLYIAGRSPTWMPSLLPATYKSPRSNSPRSSGLGGELPIVLGLMAFSDLPRGHPPTSSDDPRGFIVKVFLDPDNPYSTPEDLRSLEWGRAIVRET
ncbi:hypothetical protein FGRMN_3278 [Fusarium graminum]|nr:hypothetical protein FGRMN_3278 [Fusarium graminum]